MAVNPLFVTEEEDPDVTPAPTPDPTPTPDPEPAAVAPAPIQPIVVPAPAASLDVGEITNAAVNLGVQMGQANRQIERDIRRTYPECTDEDIEAVINGINSVGAEYTINVANAKGHLEFAKTKAYDRLIEKNKGTPTPATADRTTMGAARPRPAGGGEGAGLSGQLEQMYGKKYGKPSKAQIAKLDNFQG